MADALDDLAAEMKAGATNIYQQIKVGAQDVAANVKPAYQQIVNYDYSGLAKQIQGDAAHAQSIERGLPPAPIIWDKAKQFVSDAWNGLKTAASNAGAVPYSIQQTQSLPSVLQKANPYQGQ